MTKLEEIGKALVHANKLGLRNYGKQNHNTRRRDSAAITQRGTSADCKVLRGPTPAKVPSGTDAQ